MANALQAVLDKAAAKEPEATVPSVKPPAPPKAASRSRPSAKAKRRPQAEQTSKGDSGEKFFRPARVGKRFVGAHFDPEVARQLKMLAAEDDKTIQELLEDAVDLLFVKAGKARIADLARKL